MLCHMTGLKVGMITCVQILRGLHPNNLGGPKIENSAQFRTIFDFDREYLSKRSR